MGVSGSGKSTVGAALAGRLRVPFEDADDLHPSVNIAKLARGEPLEDVDRWPWLDRVGEWLGDHTDGGVIACSALKRSYRDQLRQHCAELECLLLQGDRDVLERRQAARVGHFMPAALLASQLATLEPLAPDERGLTVDVDRSVDDVVTAYLAYASV